VEAWIRLRDQLRPAGQRHHRRRRFGFVVLEPASLTSAGYTLDEIALPTKQLEPPS